MAGLERWSEGAGWAQGWPLVGLIPGDSMPRTGCGGTAVGTRGAAGGMLLADGRD